MPNGHLHIIKRNNSKETEKMFFFFNILIKITKKYHKKEKTTLCKTYSRIIFVLLSRLVHCKVNIC